MTEGAPSLSRGPGMAMPLGWSSTGTALEATGRRWGLGCSEFPAWKGWVPSGPPQSRFCKGSICILEYLFAKWTVLKWSTNSFLASNTEMERGVLKKPNPKNTHPNTCGSTAVFMLCQDRVRVVVEFFEFLFFWFFFFAIIDYFLAWGLEGAPMQPSQSLPSKSLLPGLIRGAAEERRRGEGSSMCFCTLWTLEMGYMDLYG